MIIPLVDLGLGAFFNCDLTGGGAALASHSFSLAHVTPSIFHCALPDEHRADLMVFHISLWISRFACFSCVLPPLDLLAIFEPSNPPSRHLSLKSQLTTNHHLHLSWSDVSHQDWSEVNLEGVLEGPVKVSHLNHMFQHLQDSWLRRPRSRLLLDTNSASEWNTAACLWI